MFRTFKDVIDAWPSLSAFAEDIGSSENTVKAMRRRDSIPSPHWKATVIGARTRSIDGVTLELLAALAAADESRNPQAAPPNEAAA